MAFDMLTSREVRDLYEKLFATDIPGLQIVSGDPIAAQMGLDPAGAPGCAPYGGCAAGVSGLTIMADGTLVPVPKAPHPHRQHTDGTHCARCGPPRKSWRGCGEKSLRGEMRCMRRWSGCRGCRGVAYAYAMVHGCDDYLAEDPQCFLENR